jgi:hypothetical protein
VSVCALASWSRLLSTARSGVEHDQKIGHARVETQACQLRRFLRAGGCGQQAFGACALRV